MLRVENKAGQREIGDVGSAAERGNQTKNVVLEESNNNKTLRE